MQNYHEDKVVWDLEVCKNIDLLKCASNIVLYGAGGKGNDVFYRLKRAGIIPSCFVDLDMSKCGGCVDGVQVVSPFELEQIDFGNDECIYIIACIEYVKEVVELLASMHLENTRLMTYWGIKMALYINREYLYKKGEKELCLINMEKERRKYRYYDHFFHHICSLGAPFEKDIWILQPGKVASTTLERRLAKNGIVFKKMHTLRYPQYLMGEEYRKTWEDSVSRLKEEPLKIVTVVREPIARDYSAFWQAFSKGNEMAMEMPILNKDFQKTYDEYIDLLLKGSMYMQDRMGSSLIFSWGDEFEWFDEQIKEILGIDVFQYPFDRESGYTIIQKGNIELFLFKVEKMESILNEISSFVGTEKLSEINDNVGVKKWYGLAYTQFRKEVKIPKEYVDHYYCGNAKMDYFYTSEEKQQFLNKWVENIV